MMMMSCRLLYDGVAFNAMNMETNLVIYKEQQMRTMTRRLVYGMDEGITEWILIEATLLRKRNGSALH